MKVHSTEDKELIEAVKTGLRMNGGYCPCVRDSLGKDEYKCMCKDFLENVKVGETCHCGLYIKDEM